LGTGIKKSELLRAGLHALESLPDAKFKTLLSQIETVKTGRPAGNVTANRVVPAKPAKAKKS